MQTGEDTHGLRKIIDFTRFGSMLILAIHFYSTCYQAFTDWHLTSVLSNRILSNLLKLGMFKTTFAVKGSSLLLLAVSLIGVRGRKDDKIQVKALVSYMILGLVLYAGAELILYTGLTVQTMTIIYIGITIVGYLLILSGGAQLSRLIKLNLVKDIFNKTNETFPQQEELLENSYSVNLPARYRLKDKIRNSWINIINPFRGLLVIGTPGAGKSYFIIRHIITQHIKKGFTMFLYDFKFDDLTKIAYNTLLKYHHGYKVKPQFYVINFDDLDRTHRCNPLEPQSMEDLTDATEASRAIMLGLNREWIRKQGDFFVESPINFVTAMIWFLRRYVPRQTIDAKLINAFFEKAGAFERILSDSGYVKLSRLTNEELTGTKAGAGIIEQYLYLLGDGERPLVKDVHLKNQIRVGEDWCNLFTLADVEDLPALCGSRMTYDPYSTDKTRFSTGFAAPLGLLLDCNHVYSQYIFIGDELKVMKQLEAKKLRLQSLSAYSRENAIARDATNDFLNEAISQQRLPVKAHFNVLAWANSADELQQIRNKVGSAMARIDAQSKLETDGAPQIWWGGIPGNAADFPTNDTFETFLEQATCFLNMESVARSAKTGIRFGERLSGRPLLVDLFDTPMKNGTITNRNLFVCGGSGGGKSMTMNHLLRTLFDQGTHCVTIDIGGSYKGLCELMGGYYFTYTEENPIKFNPFYIGPGEVLDTEKKESLKTLLVSLWKQEDESYNRSEYVALSNALQGYYDHLRDDNSLFPCFNTFYEYLENHYVDVLEAHKVQAKDFSIHNFLYVLRPYYKGGEFDYLLNATENLDLLNQRFIVFELDNLKSHPILFPVVTLIIMELFISKMRKLVGQRKIIAIDEAWVAIAKAGMSQFIKYLYKTVRKFNGIAALVTQEIDDLISSPILKETVINNADTKILMDMRKFMNKFDKLQEVLGLSDKAKTMLLSVNKANEPGRNYREVFIDQGGQELNVYRNELSVEEYLCYSTEESEKLRVQEYTAKYGSIEKGIAALANEIKSNKS